MSIDLNAAVRRVVNGIEGTRVAQIVIEQSKVYPDPNGSAEFILRVGRYQGNKFMASSTPQVEKDWKIFREAVLIADADDTCPFTVDISKHFLIPPGVGSERFRWRIIVQPRRDANEVPMYGMPDVLTAFAECFRIDTLVAPGRVESIELSAPAGRNVRQDASKAGVSEYTTDAKSNFRPEKPRT